VKRLLNRFVDREHGGGLRRNGGLLLGAGLAVLAAIALTAYLAGAFDSGGHRHTGATFTLPTADGTQDGGAPGSGAAGGNSQTGGRRDTTAGAGDSPILRALDNYWEDIEQHAYSAAFGFYAPGAIDLTEAEFISEQQHAGVKSVSFEATVTASTKALDQPNRSYATVAVTSLLTHDAQHGCRKWSGSYTMLLEESGLWHIQHAALNAHPC
jgi:hypothetical protein